MPRRIRSVESFNEFAARFWETCPKPAAFGVGLATPGKGDVPRLEAYFEVPNYNANFGTAAVLASLTGYTGGNAVCPLSRERAHTALDMLSVFEGDGGRHPNIEALNNVRMAPVGKLMVVVFDEDVTTVGPASTEDAYLRLHLLSHRLAKPNELNLDGIFGVLPNVAWTSEGPMLPDDAARRLRGRHAGFKIYAVDKFPPMLDYVIPSGVRIADGARVRLGAHLAEGTTVMHAGFVNYNAGTLGKAMIEGRISQGVVIDEGSDLGGSASTMGTLSGGGTERVRVGKRSLVGANAGIGISLGDDCVVEAGLYVTAGTPVVYRSKVVKGRELSGKDGLQFIRNGETGAVEARERANTVSLNEALHAP